MSPTPEGLKIPVEAKKVLPKEVRRGGGEGLVRVSDPQSEDDISDLVYRSQVKGAF